MFGTITIALGTVCVCVCMCVGGGGVSFIFVRLSFTSPCHKLDVLLSSWRGNDFATNLPLHSGTIFAIVLQPSFKANTSTLNREHFQSVDDVILKDNNSNKYFAPLSFNAL